MHYRMKKNVQKYERIILKPGGDLQITPQAVETTAQENNTLKTLR